NKPIFQAGPDERRCPSRKRPVTRMTAERGLSQGAGWLLSERAVVGRGAGARLRPAPRAVRPRRDQAGASGTEPDSGWSRERPPNLIRYRPPADGWVIPPLLTPAGPLVSSRAGMPSRGIAGTARNSVPVRIPCSWPIFSSSVSWATSATAWSCGVGALVAARLGTATAAAIAVAVPKTRAVRTGVMGSASAPSRYRRAGSPRGGFPWRGTGGGGGPRNGPPLP